MLDPTHLRYFCAVAGHGSLSAAARALRVSQPALTRSIKAIERQFAAELLHRDHSGVTLTPAGQQLLTHAERILGALERCEREIRALEHDELGRFVVGCHEALGAYILPGFMAEIMARAPGIELSVWNGTSRAVRDAVVVREVHFGLVVNPEPHADLVIVELFHDETTVFVHAPGGAPEAERGTGATLDTARAHILASPVIFSDAMPQSVELLDRLAADGCVPRRLLPCTSLEVVKSLTAAGVGPGLLPRRVALAEQPRLLRPLHAGLPSIRDAISLIYRADMHRTRAANLLKDTLVAWGARLETTAD